LKFDVLLAINGAAVLKVKILSMFFNDMMLLVIISDLNMFVINNLVYIDQKMGVQRPKRSIFGFGSNPYFLGNLGSCSSYSSK